MANLVLYILLEISNFTTPTLAPADFTVITDNGNQAQQSSSSQGAAPATHRIVIVPGLEFDPARKYRYGLHSLSAAVLISIAFIMIELRDCQWGPGIDLERLQGLHIAMMVFAFVLYLLSLFGIADFIFKYKIFFLLGALLIYGFAALMIWMTYEAAVNPCVKTFGPIPIDATPGQNKNVFSRGDGVGIIVLLLDIFATLLMISAASNFYKRY